MNSAQKTAQKTVVITGGNAGLGYYAAEQLAARGHRIIIASRNAEKTAGAIQAIQQRVSNADISFVELDLASLSSIQQAATQLKAEPSIDVLLLNAGVVGSRTLRTTHDGYELQIGTNYLGHFALVSALLPKLEDQQQARIIHLGSISHRWVRLPTSALFPKSYRNFVNYAVSKLAVTSYGFELAKRLKARHSSVESIVVHPGFSWDHFDSDIPEILQKKPLPWYLAAILTPVAQGKRQGAQVLSFVSDSTLPKSGEYWGPSGFFQLRGSPTLRKAKAHSYRGQAAERLWRQTEDLLADRLK